jgi:hypothetical protein
MTKDRRNTESESEPERRGWADAVARDARLVGQAAFVRAGFKDPSLVLRWAEIAGPEVARLATPVKLSESTQGGVLTLKAEPGAALFLQHETRPLCDRINAYLGRQAVAKLRFVQGTLISRPAPKHAGRPVKAVAPNDAARKFVGSEKMREALLRLAKARRCD